MAIICGPTTVSISLSPQSICDHLVSISDIGATVGTIDVLVDSQTIPGVGIVSGVKSFDGTLSYDVSLVSKDVSTNTATITFTVESVQVTPPPTATNYIEYNLSFLPSDFRSFISSSLTGVSTYLGTYLPFPSNIQYVSSDFDSSSGSFKIYVVYTPAASLFSLDSPEAVYGYENVYVLGEDGKIEILITIPTSLDALAAFFSGILIFALVSSRLALLPGGAPWALPVGAITAVVGAILIGWSIHDISSGATTTGSTTQPDPATIQANIGDFANLTRTKCLELYPGCDTGACTGETSDLSKQRGYNQCIAAVSLAEYTSDENAKGTFSQAAYNALAAQYQATDTCLANKTCTTQQAAAQTKTNTNGVITNNQNAVTAMTCTSGYTYDKTTQKCVKSCYVSVPLIGCLDPILEVGGLLIGGYLVIKYVLPAIMTKKPTTIVATSTKTAVPITGG